MAMVFTKLKRVLGGQKQAIKAEHFNDIVRAVEELQNALSPTGKKNRRTAVIPPPFWTTLSQVPESDPAEYQVSVTLGYLTYQNAGASEADQGVTGYIVPKIDGVALDDEAVQPLELPAVVSYVYLRVKTTADGVPKFSVENPPVTIEAFDEPQKSVHHVRPSPSGGEEEGDYFFLICETEEIPDSDPAAPRIKRRLTGNRELPNQLIEIENIGEGELDQNYHELYKGYDVGPDDKHQIRTLKQIPIPTNEGGEPSVSAARLIVPKADPNKPGDSIKVKIIKKGNSESTPYSFEDEDESATLRFEGANVEEGNVRKFSISVKDGIVDSFTKEDDNLWWGQIALQYQPAVGSLQTLTIDVESGSIVNVESSQGGAGDGTENNPEIILFQFGDT